MVADWNASLYLKFEDERTRPAQDLLAQVPLRTARRVVDLGCGPGNSTELLAARFPDAQIIGIDTSPDMLATARKRLPQATFIQGDVGSLALDEPADLIFANAVLQWVPNHDALFPHLMSQVAPGGVLAVQMPDNLDEPSHAGMRTTAAAGPWAAALGAAPAARTPRLPVSFYYDLLSPSVAHLNVWKTIYEHPLADTAAIVEWLKSTGLRPFLEPLDAQEKAAYLTAYEAQLAKDYPVRADGKVLLAFPRLFLVALR